MTEVKHTPGEWRTAPIYPMSVTSSGDLQVHREMGIAHHTINSVLTIADGPIARQTTVIASALLTKGREEEAQANARLIAAAPDMLDALKFYDQAIGEDELLEARVRATQAIAKAEGR